MLDFSWSELALIAVVALVVIGPKDLPKALRTVGIWVRRARTISREFQSSIEQMVREAELDEVKKQIETVSTIDLGNEIKQAVDPTGSLSEALQPPELPDMKTLVEETPPPAAPAAAAVETTMLPPPEAVPPVLSTPDEPPAAATEAPRVPASTPPEPHPPAPLPHGGAP